MGGGSDQEDSWEKVEHSPGLENGDEMEGSGDGGEEREKTEQREPDGADQDASGNDQGEAGETHQQNELGGVVRQDQPAQAEAVPSHIESRGHVEGEEEFRDQVEEEVTTSGESVPGGVVSSSESEDPDHQNVAEDHTDSAKDERDGRDHELEERQGPKCWKRVVTTAVILMLVAVNAPSVLQATVGFCKYEELVDSYVVPIAVVISATLGYRQARLRLPFHQKGQVCETDSTVNEPSWWVYDEKTRRAKSIQGAERSKSSEFVFLCREGQLCKLPPSSQPWTVRYGKDEQYIYRDLQGLTSFKCTNRFFGADPLNGVSKECYISGNPPAWVTVCKDDSACLFATGWIRYGRVGAWVYKALSGPFSCSSQEFHYVKPRTQRASELVCESLRLGTAQSSLTTLEEVLSLHESLMSDSQSMRRELANLSHEISSISRDLNQLREHRGTPSQSQQAPHIDLRAGKQKVCKHGKQKVGKSKPADDPTRGVRGGKRHSTGESSGTSLKHTEKKRHLGKYWTTHPDKHGEGRPPKSVQPQWCT